MCGFHQGQRQHDVSSKGRIYGRNILFVTNELFPCIAGRTIYDPIIAKDAVRITHRILLILRKRKAWRIASQ